MTPLEAALAYASWGWAVLPVVPNGKIPASAHGVKDATTDETVIRNWWETNPNYNVGIAAGKRSGIIVFDIDPRNGGDDSWNFWTNENGQADDGATQLTAGGGQHYLAVYDDAFRSCKLADGVDLLSDGRYFVAYPSTIESRSYQWEGSSDPFEGVAPTKVPQKWRDAFAKRSKKGNGASVPIGGIISGNRNAGLTAIGGSMRRYGMSEAEIMAALAIANETRCDIPLPSSELSQIVRSVCRYAPESDVAADAALGDDAAESILASVEQERTGFFLTRASSLLTQPAAIEWVIRGWLPANGIAMIYGESGVGKSFVALDMACHIVTGKAWRNSKTKCNQVVYMAGEGNYGMRSRIASWCKHHGVAADGGMNRLLVSNQAIDMDSPDAAAIIIRAVRDLTKESVSVLYIDTLNNHMAGDENAAKDARAMLNVCAIVARALGATVVLVHHTGHAEDAKGRARGSSAWKAALDASILVSRRDDVLAITCTKMKDALPPDPLHGGIKTVELDWVDDEGDPVCGAVFVETEAPIKVEKTDSKIDRYIKTIVNIWNYSGQEVNGNGEPYFTKSAAIEYLVSHDGKSHSTAEAYLKPSRTDKLIGALLNAQVIRAYSHGWAVESPEVASCMLVTRLNK